MYIGKLHSYSVPYFDKNSKNTRVSCFYQHQTILAHKIYFSDQELLKRYIEIQVYLVFYLHQTTLAHRLYLLDLNLLKKKKKLNQNTNVFCFYQPQIILTHEVYLSNRELLKKFKQNASVSCFSLNPRPSWPMTCFFWTKIY